MDVAGVYLELFGRIEPLAREAVDGASPDQLTATVVPGTNPVGWLVWHLTRVQDHHMAEIVGGDQVWPVDGWAARFGLEPDPSNTGYGHTPAQVAAVRPESADALLGYLAAVSERTSTYLDALTPADLDRVVDRRWDPPVTLGVRLVSIADDSLQHAGQAAYLRGLLRQAS
jgi:hypothetical protein